MKIGLQSLRERRNFAPDGSVPNSGNMQMNDQNNGNNPPPQNQQQQNNNNQQQNQNNGGNNDEIFLNMWNDEEDNSQQNNNQNNNNQNNNNNNGNNGISAAEQFNTYINGLDFSDGIDVEQLQNDLSQGKVNSLTDAMKKSGQNAYKQAMLDAQKLIKDNVERAVSSAVNKSRGMMHADSAIREMNDKFPYTKDKAIAPVAEEVLKRFMKKGQDLDVALVSMDKFFQRTNQLVGGNKGRSRNQGFGGNSSDNGNDFDGDESEDIDFLSILSER